MAHFKIDNNWLVQRIKDRVLNGNWEEAISNLKEFYSLNYDDAIDIIKGNKNIINDEVVEQVDSKYKEQVLDIYLGEAFIHNQNKIMRFIKSYSLDEFAKLCIIDGHIIDRGVGLPMELRDFSNIPYYLSKYWDIDQYVFQEVFFNSANPRLCILEEIKNIPFWLSREDVMFKSIKEYLTSKGLLSKQENKIIKLIEQNNEIYSDISFKHQIASSKLHTMKDLAKSLYGHDNLKEIQEDLRSVIITKYNENNFEWRKMKFKGIDGNDIEIDVPIEIVLAYLKKDSIDTLDSDCFKNKWTEVSPSGLKMQHDSSLHTDLWLALGFNLDENIYLRDSIDNSIFYDVIFEIRREFLELNKIEIDFDVMLDIGMKKFSGKVVFEDCENITDRDILVIPNANLKYEKIAKKAGIVIFENGSELSHLFIANKNENWMLPLIRIEDAVKKLSIYKNKNITIDFIKNKIEYN